MQEDIFEKEILTKKEILKYQSFLNGYDFYDIIKCVFCLNSYLGNRSHLVLNFRLNYALIHHSHKGIRRIDNYENFCEFCEKIKDYYDATFDDEMSLDNGEVLFKYNNEFRKCLLGNGYNRSYAFYNSLYNFGKHLNIQDSLETVLNNNDLLINFVSKHNPRPEEYDHTEIYIPCIEYFDFVLANFDDFRKNYIRTDYDLEPHRIIDTISFSYNEEWFPLFNASGPISFMTSILKSLNYEEFIELFRINLICSIFDLYDVGYNTYILGAAFLKKLDSKESLLNLSFDLIIIFDNKLIIFKNSSEWTKEEEKRFGNELTELIKGNKVFIYTNVNKEKSVFEIKNIDDFVIYNIYPGLHFDLESDFIKNDNNLIHYYDLIQILLLSKSLDEIANFFILFSKSTERIFSTAAPTDFFIFYQSQKGMIQAGALSFGSYMFDIYTTEYHFFELFKDFHRWFVFKNQPLLENPFIWDIKNEENKVTEIVNKKYALGVFTLTYKINNKNIVFNFNPIIGGEYNLNLITDIGLLRDLITNYLPQFNLIFDKCIKSDCSFLFMSQEYASKLKGFKGMEQSSHKYVFSDCIVMHQKLHFRYCIDFESFKNDEINSINNNVEIKLWKELLECLSKYSFINQKDIFTCLDNLKNNKKEIALFSYTPTFYYSDKPMKHFISEEMEAETAKDFSFVAKEVGLIEGEYTKKDFRKRVRLFQKTALKLFEDKVSVYALFDLHIFLLSVLSTTYFERMLANKRSETLESGTYSERCFKVSKNNILIQENENKFSIRAILFLIDTNLSIKHTGNKIPDNHELSKLICMAKFLVRLQDDSDIAHYDIEPIKLKVNYDFRITPIYNNETNEKSRLKSQRLLECRAYTPSVKTDIKKHLENVKVLFENDTGVNLDDMKNILIFLSDSIGYENYEVIPNVIKIEKDKLINGVKELYKNNKIECNGIEKAIEFLTIKLDEIKVQNGTLEEFVPIWNREGRSQRFEIRPIVEIDKYLVYSPIHCNIVDILWGDGFLNFYLPFEYGLEKTRDYLINTWKPECELLMEVDIEQLFIKSGIKAVHSIFLNSRFPNSLYPNDLGDYDVLAIDENKKIIYNIESKYLSFQGSIREYFNFQDWFFSGKNRRDKVFKKRIEYLKHHTHKVINDVFMISNVDGFIIKNLMVTNKILTCDIGKVDFDIISFSELEDMIKNN